jgi:hypothetical protein
MPTARPTEIDGLDEIARLLATQIRLSLPNQTAAILELNRAGLATAKTTVAKAKKKGAA